MGNTGEDLSNNDESTNSTGATDPPQVQSQENTTEKSNDEDTHDVPGNNNEQVASTMTQENANTDQQQGQGNTGEENEVESTEGSEYNTDSDDDTFTSQDIIDACDSMDIDNLKSIPKEKMKEHLWDNYNDRETIFDYAIRHAAGLQRYDIIDFFLEEYTHENDYRHVSVLTLEGAFFYMHDHWKKKK